MRVRRITGIFRELSRMMAVLTGILQENVAAIKLVKAFNREGYESDRFLEQYWAIRNRRLRSTRLMQGWSQVQEVSTALSNVLVLYFGALRVMDGSLTIGPGHPLRFRYRVVIHSGDAKEAHIADLYKEYRSER